MSALAEALRKKYQSPRAAMAALGIDSSLLTNTKGLPFMSTNKTALSRTGLLAQGALAVFLKPKMALDARFDLTPILATLTAKNFKDRTPTIVSDIKRKTAGKLAADASIDDIAEVLEALAPILPADDPDPVDPVVSDDDDSELLAALKAKGYTDEEAAAIVAKTKPAVTADEDDEEKKKLAEQVKAKDAEMKDMVKKPAMDAAIANARTETIKAQNEIRDAERAVRPWVGDLAMSFDSAEGVHRAALKTLGSERADTAHKDALLDILGTYAKPGDKPRRTETPIAQDAAAAKGFAERYPAASNIRVQ